MKYQKLRSGLLIGIVVLSMVSFMGMGSAATTSELSLEPSDGQSVQTGETVTYDVVLGTVDNGIGAWNYTVSVDNTSVATITSASSNVASSGALSGGTTSLAADNSSVTFDGFTSASKTGSGSDFVLATVTVEGQAAGSTNLSLSVNYLEDTANNAYTLSSVTNTSLSVTSQPSPTVHVAPSQGTVANEGYSMFSVVIENASDGVGAFKFNVTTSDIQTVEIVSATSSQDDTEGFSSFSADVASDNSSIQIEGVSTSALQGEEITLAQVRVYGVQEGTSSLSVSFANGYLQGPDSSTQYTVSESDSASVTVQPPPEPVEGSNSPPADHDRDGKYEDVDGNGVVDGRDVLTLWINQNNVSEAFFDYNNDGVTDGRDVLALWNNRN